MDYGTSQVANSIDSSRPSNALCSDAQPLECSTPVMFICLRTSGQCVLSCSAAHSSTTLCVSNFVSVNPPHRETGQG